LPGDGVEMGHMVGKGFDRTEWASILLVVDVEANGVCPSELRHACVVWKDGACSEEPDVLSLKLDGAGASLLQSHHIFPGP
jgi:hypothetical protein